MNRFHIISPLFFVLLALTISTVYAQDEIVDLNTFPQQLADHFNVSLFAGQHIATALLMLCFVLPVAIFSKNMILSLFVGFITLGTSIALGWLPYWYFLIISFLISLMFGGKIRDWVSGR